MARGRPPKPEPERKSRYVSFRARSGLQARLAAAAQQSERSVSEEIERRLERSFITEGFERQLVQQGSLLAKIATKLGVDDAPNLVWVQAERISGQGSMTADERLPPPPPPLPPPPTLRGTLGHPIAASDDELISALQCFLSLRELISKLKKVELGQERATILSRGEWLLDEIVIAWKTANFAALSEKLDALTRKQQNVEVK